MLRVVGVSQHLVPSEEEVTGSGSSGHNLSCHSGIDASVRQRCSSPDHPSGKGTGERQDLLGTGRRFALEAHETHKSLSGQPDKPQTFWVVLLGPSRVCVGDKGLLSLLWEQRGCQGSGLGVSREGEAGALHES